MEKTINLLPCYMEIFKKIILTVIVLVICFSCNEKEYLREIPLDFYAPENSYVTSKDFDAAIYGLHSLYRTAFWNDRQPRHLWIGSDLVESYYDVLQQQDFQALWGSTGEISSDFWSHSYHLIYNANAIIGRSESDLTELTDTEKTIYQAEARFWRGYIYTFMAHMWGGVPLVLEETQSPKRDYVRATRQEVYEQCADDLKFAADNLPDIGIADESRINKLAASHVLAEVYISLGRWQDAIDEASKVISHPATALMTERFGTSQEKMFNDPDWEGDLYWDLFRQGNQDRFRGNTESIWVLQFSNEYSTPGGGESSDYILARNVCPDLTKAMILQSNGKTSPVLAKPNTYYNNRGLGYCKPSPYYFNTLWAKSGDGDMRCSKWNIVRDYKVLNPSSQYNGKWVIADNLPLIKALANDTSQFFYPTLTKTVTPGMDPKELWDQNQTIPGSLRTSARRTWRKHYQIRLAETYLLRAEAYLGKGDATKAAEDINVVRRRANAPDVTPDKVDIEYILDERMRELAFEELRLVTLARLGKMVDRTKRINPVAGRSIKSHQNLWAIPFSEITKNTEAILEQNPGY
ncbi:MAG: RagB/SusD family nutrient uptake outer membrane protein [Prolixibacteraceae bacterium]|nr:RagB/SusD family nutrient uptake outer membrane protein [Prolixibacteraceae bacterium]